MRLHAWRFVRPSGIAEGREARPAGRRRCNKPIAACAVALFAFAWLGASASNATAAPPTIEGESVSNVTYTDATLEADIDTGGLATEYRFHLAYGCGFPGELCPQYCIAGQPCPGPWNSIINVPLPSANLPASSGVRHVSLDLNSIGVTLEPYKYRYSVHATNTAGSATGPDQFFRPGESLPARPTNTEPPQLSGVPAVGETLTCSDGVWSGSPTSFAYAWRRDGDVISGQTANEYTVQAADQGHNLKCEVTASNAGGSASETSNALSVPPPPPVNTAVPVLSGSPTVGQVLHCSNGSWENSPTSFAYAWQRDGGAIAGQTTNEYTVQGPDRGSELSCEVTATNAAGSTSALSESLEVPQPPVIEAESVSNITQTDATLEADIDPGGLATHYQFRLAYGCGFEGEVCPQYCIPEQPCPGPWNSIITVPLPSGNLPASTDVQHVSLDLNSIGVTLEPYKYRYSVEATNSEGTAQGGAQYFRPASSPPPPSTSAPTVEGESASQITPTEAKLEAEINPNGLETEYEFWLEYRVCQNPTPPDTAVCWAIAGERRGEGTIPATYGGQAVSTTLTDLSPGYTYTFWTVATNTKGEDTSLKQEFTTPAVPTIEGESTSSVSQTNATLEAEVNLHEAAAGAYYQFQLVDDTSEYESEILCPPTLQPGYSGCIGPAGAGALPIGFIPGNSLQPSAIQPASLDLSSAGVTLQPGSTYHFRILVARAVQTEDTIEWEPPTVYGDDQTFTTPSEPSLQVSPSSQDQSAIDTPTLQAETGTDGVSSQLTQQRSSIHRKSTRRCKRGARNRKRIHRGSTRNRHRRPRSHRHAKRKSFARLGRNSKASSKRKICQAVRTSKRSPKR